MVVKILGIVIYICCFLVCQEGLAEEDIYYNPYVAPSAEKQELSLNEACKIKTGSPYAYYSWDSKECHLDSRNKTKPGQDTSTQQERPWDLKAFCEPLNSAVQDCESKTISAKDSACNFKADTGINNAMKFADGISKAFAVTTAGSIEAACSKMKDLTVVTSGAMAAFRSVCAAAQSDCTQSCRSAEELLKSNSQYSLCEYQVKTIRDSKKQCADFTTNINEAGVYVQSLYAAKINADQCKNLTGNSLEQMCKNNPGSPLCANLSKSIDCSNPQVATTNPVCICQSNPSDPSCRGLQKPNSAAGNVVSNSDISQGTADAAAKSGAVSMGSGGEQGSGFDAEISPPKAGSGGGSAGGKGAGRSISGDGGATSGSSGRGAQGSAGTAGGSHTKVLSGYYGGGGMMGGFGGGSRYSGNSTESPAAGNVPANEKIDLKQFLPGGKLDPRRALAGISGPDGITGPHSNLWQKVNVRYKSITISLKP